MTAQAHDESGFDDLARLVDGLGVEEIEAVVGSLSADVVSLLVASDVEGGAPVPASPVEQARALDPLFTVRPHLTYLSDRIRQAVKDVEAGQSRFLAVSMPPRMGKTTLTTFHTPLWVLRRNPHWPVALISHDSSLVTSWGRKIRRTVEQHPLGIDISPDAGAVKEWETTSGGMVLSRTWREQLTGRGVKVLIIDDPIKDAADASSATLREGLWEWWQSTAQTRFEPPVLVIVVMTRWHEDDLTGRLLSQEHDGDPADWEVISFPALANDADVLGRQPGQPLLSPLIDETEEDALTRWTGVKRNVGSYTWSALYQQSPAPSTGAIFDPGWWHFWTDNPAQAEGRDNVHHIDLDAIAGQGRWLDSWDMAFKGSDSSDFVVGQRWLHYRAWRILIAQHRERMTFSQTLAVMHKWSSSAVPYSDHVHTRLVEDKANGTAIIDVLKDEVAGLIPVNPTESKEARARAVSPLVEAGNVLLPLPSMPGYEWVTDLLGEARNFPRDVHDDQIDALTQALRRLKETGTGRVSVPTRRPGVPVAGRSLASTVQTAANVRRAPTGRRPPTIRR